MLSEEAAIALLLATLPAHCCLEWCWYEGEQLVAQPNLEATRHAGRVMLDLSYCMTEAINQHIERTVAYEPAAFHPINPTNFSQPPLPDARHDAPTNPVAGRRPLAARHRVRRPAR
ncbi:MAG: hypothetical protein ACRYG7_14940 [Janthinobacterium lividum]